MKRIIVALILLTLATPSWAGFDEGVAAYRRGDYATALREFRPLAEQGHGDAQSWMGVIYDNGRAVPQDHAEAVKWYRKAAEQGDVIVQYRLGSMYARGEGVPHDDTQAAKWFRMAAEQGHAAAQFNLGWMVRRGKGVLQDYVQAHKWYNLAATLGNENGTKYRNNLAKKMTPAQIAEAQKLAREWYAAFQKRKGK